MIEDFMHTCRKLSSENKDRILPLQEIILLESAGKSVINNQ
jgi:hypothetical protein